MLRDGLRGTNHPIRPGWNGVIFTMRMPFRLMDDLAVTVRGYRHRARARTVTRAVETLIFQ